MSRKTLLKSHDIAFFALGGLDEVGKNTYVFEIYNKIYIVDAGQMFPDHHLLGVDYVIPNYQYLIDNEERIQALFITHGHEDHIGGIPYLLKQVKIPKIFASGIAVELIESKLVEHKDLEKPEIINYNSNSVFKFGKVEVSFIRLNHSIPDMHGINFKTPEGNLFHTGDFKFDFTPVGPSAEFHKLTKIGEEGVLCLFSDSTNALISGNIPSERVIGESIDDIFRNIKGRIIIATFASNLYRMQQIVNASYLNGRKVIVIGRSMEKMMEAGINSGYINVPKNTIVPSSDISQYPANKITILSTGSQGEPLAALSRIASGTHKEIQVEKDDTVIFSSSPIPGNQEGISKIIDMLYRKNVEVIINGPVADTHTSGHGAEDDLLLMISLTKPKYFIPVHGEHRMLKGHQNLGIQYGIPKENTLVLDNGEVALLGKDELKVVGEVPAGDVYIDGLGIGSTGSSLIRERKLLSEDGLLAIVLSIDENKKLIKKQTLVSRGFIFMKKSEDLILKIQELTEEIYNGLIINNVPKNKIEDEIKDSLQTFLYETGQRKPVLILSIISVQ